MDSRTDLLVIKHTIHHLFDGAHTLWLLQVLRLERHGTDQASKYFFTLHHILQHRFNVVEKCSRLRIFAKLVQSKLFTTIISLGKNIHESAADTRDLYVI